MSILGLLLALLSAPDSFAQNINHITPVINTNPRPPKRVKCTADAFFALDIGHNSSLQVVSLYDVAAVSSGNDPDYSIVGDMFVRPFHDANYNEINFELDQCEANLQAANPGKCFNWNNPFFKSTSESYMSINQFSSFFGETTWVESIDNGLPPSPSEIVEGLWWAIQSYPNGHIGLEIDIDFWFGGGNPYYHLSLDWEVTQRGVMFDCP